jgi:hypothetical protein
MRPQPILEAFAQVTTVTKESDVAECECRERRVRAASISGGSDAVVNARRQFV